LVPGQAAKDADKEEKERIARQRILLRIVAELGLVDAWPEGIKKGASEVGKVIQALVSSQADEWIEANVRRMVILNLSISPY